MPFNGHGTDTVCNAEGFHCLHKPPKCLCEALILTKRVLQHHTTSSKDCVLNEEQHIINSLYPYYSATFTFLQVCLTQNKVDTKEIMGEKKKNL